MLEAISSTAITAGQAAASRIDRDAGHRAQRDVAGSGRRRRASSVLKQVTTDAIGTLKAGEARRSRRLQGKESTRQVVDAVMTAEQALADRRRDPRQGRRGLSRSQSNVDLI